MPDFPPLTPVPLCYLQNKGDLVTATATCDPATLALGTAGEVLTVSASSPTGLAWCPPYGFNGFLSCNSFTDKGDLLVNVAFAGDAALPLHVGNSGQFLTADPSSCYTMSWQDIPITYTGPGQLLVADKDKNYATIQGCQGAILQYQVSNPVRWTATCGTDVYTKQEQFQKGTLAIGTGPNESNPFAVGPDNSVLSVCTTSPYGVGWKPVAFPNPINCVDRVCYNACRDPAPLLCELAPGSSFGEGCTVFVQVTGDWYLDSQNCAFGRIGLRQGFDGSYLIPYGHPWKTGQGNPSQVCRPQYNLGYIFKNWRSFCGLCMIVWFDNDISQVSERAVDFRADVTAFAL